jgi:hypothetical protein
MPVILHIPKAFEKVNANLALFAMIQQTTPAGPGLRDEKNMPPLWDKGMGRIFPAAL